MTDMVNEPPHYKSDTGLEAIEVIRAFFRESYNLGTVFKYIARAGKKWDTLEDLKKARRYLDWEIEWREEQIEQEKEDNPVIKMNPIHFPISAEMLADWERDALTRIDSRKPLLKGWVR